MSNTTTTETIVTEYDPEGRVVKTTKTTKTTTTSELPDITYPTPPLPVWESYRPRWTNQPITCDTTDAQDRYGYTSRVVE